MLKEDVKNIKVTMCEMFAYMKNTDKKVDMIINHLQITGKNTE